MKTRTGIFLTFITILLTGCATPQQQPIALSDEVIGSKSERIGVAMTPLPQVDTQFPGANCLLCIATASMVNSSLTSHANTLSADELLDLKKEMVTLLQAKGVDAVEIPGQIDVSELPDLKTSDQNIARKDYSSLQQKYAIGRILVIDIRALGFTREYSAYIPTSSPRAMLYGLGYIVNLKNNAYDWYKPVYVSNSSDADWDEPPKFPGLTNAYFQSLEIAKDNFREAFVDNPENSRKQPSAMPTAPAGK